MNTRWGEIHPKQWQIDLLHTKGKFWNRSTHPQLTELVEPSNGTSKLYPCHSKFWSANLDSSYLRTKTEKYQWCPRPFKTWILHWSFSIKVVLTTPPSFILPNSFITFRNQHFIASYHYLFCRCLWNMHTVFCLLNSIRTLATAYMLNSSDTVIFSAKKPPNS